MSQTETHHYPTDIDRAGPLASYVLCEDCGRTANTVDELDQRPCRDGIPVDEMGATTTR